MITGISSRNSGPTNEASVIRRDGEDSMGTELDKMLAGELYDPMDSELVRARDRARDLCQDLNVTREAQIDERRHLLKQLFGKGGETVWMQPPFYCDYGFEHLAGRAGVLQFQLHRTRRVSGNDRGLHPVRPGGSSLYRHPSDERRPEAETRVRQADRNRLRRVGRGRCDHLSWGSNRLPVGHRSRQRGHTGRARWGVRRWQPVPGGPGNHRVLLD